jgi:two-component system, LytTR family, sensor kinase
MDGLDGTGLLHLLGFVTGAALYALLLVLALRPRSSPSWDRLPLVTAVLGLVWNLGAAATWALGAFEIATGAAAISAVSYAALGILPAAVVHAVLRREGDEQHRTARVTVIVAAWSLSLAGAALQALSALTDARVGSAALLALTVVYVALTVPLFFLTRRQPAALRSWWVVALAIFAISGLHLSTKHLGEYSWGIELFGHHASLPLAFAILIHDYRFAFADIFLKRAIALVALVFAASVGVVTIGLPLVRESGHETLAAAVVVLFCVATAAIHPWIRRGTDRFVDRVLLRRHDLETFRALAGARLEIASSAGEALDELCALVAAAFSASAAWSRETEGARAVPVRLLTSLERDRWRLVVPTTEQPRFVVDITGLSGGRTFLSDDEVLLDGAALAAARRIDAIRLTNERVEQETREQNLRRLTSEAELRALRAQINPHFLFNALNTLGYLIRTSPDRAFDTLLRLTGLLRSVLRSKSATSTLREERKMVEAYLEIERARFEERLAIEIDIPASLDEVEVPAFVLQPVVENAVKHGIEESSSGGTVRVEAVGGAGGRLTLRVSDTGAGAEEADFGNPRGEGIGIENIRRRLAALYGHEAELRFRSAPGRGTVVEIEIPVAARSVAGGAS